MKILLVDDNFLYSNGLQCFLQDNDIEVVGTAVSGLEAINKAAMLGPDVILMDVKMAGCDGIETTRIIKQDFPHIEIVMLTVCEEDEHLFAALRAGASGYLLKGMDAGKLLADLRRLADGEPPLAPGMARRILQEFSDGQQPSQTKKPDTKEPGPKLSSRQAEVIKLLAQGKTYKEIGAALNIRDVTVRYHVYEVLNKLHLSNRAQLIAHVSLLDL